MSTRPSRATTARRELAARIMDGAVPAGTPLRIPALTHELGMSATPVREALHLLVGDRLVEYVPMRGFFVTEPPGPEQVRSMGEARLVLEPELAALAARRAAEEEVAELRRILERTDRAPQGTRFHEYEGYFQHSSSFHAEIARIARSPYLEAALAAIPVHTLRFRRFGTGGVDDAEVSVLEHQRVLTAIARGDAGAARNAMQEHVAAVTRRALA